jgi:hypothetical protein
LKLADDDPRNDGLIVLCRMLFIAKPKQEFRQSDL